MDAFKCSLIILIAFCLPNTQAHPSHYYYYFIYVSVTTPDIMSSIFSPAGSSVFMQQFLKEQNIIYGQNLVLKCFVLFLLNELTLSTLSAYVLLGDV